MAESNWSLDLVKAAGPSLVVVVGWFVANKFTVDRERQNTKRSMIVQELDCLSHDLDRLSKVIFRYHEGERSIKQERTINVSLQDLTQRVTNIGALSRSVTTSANLTRFVNDFKRKATLKHFEDGHHGALDQDDPQLQEIAAASHRLRETFSKAKFEQIDA